MVNSKQHSGKPSVRQRAEAVAAEPLKIRASTPYDFKGRNLTAYGGLFPVGTMLEKLGFRQLVEENLTIKRRTRVMPAYEFVLAMVLAFYIGFSRLNHLQFLKSEPMLTGILKVQNLPPQSTFWRFLASLQLSAAGQILRIQQALRQRVWEAANIQLKEVTIDTDTTVHTLFGHQMGGRKSFNPKNPGKKSYQPILTFLAETREYISGGLHNGDRHTGAQITRHLKGVFAALPLGIETIKARADAGFYCAAAVQTYERAGVQFIIVAHKAGRLLDALKAAEWKKSRDPEADGECDLLYQPKAWSKAYRHIALRYKQAPKSDKQLPLIDTLEYRYRVFITNMEGPVTELAEFYDGRAGAENLIKESNNDAGLAAYPSARWDMNCNHFQLAMMAYNLNCWLIVFNREEEAKVKTLHHTMLSTTRLKSVFVAARIHCHAGLVGISYSDHYAEKGLFQRLMERLRAVARSGSRLAPVIPIALRC
jgi:hypothetical protein